MFVFCAILFCFWFLACLVSFGWLWCLLAVLVGGCCGWLRGWGGLFELIWVWIGFLGYWNGLRADLRWLFWLFGLVCGLFFYVVFFVFSFFFISFLGGIVFYF